MYIWILDSSETCDLFTSVVYLDTVCWLSCVFKLTV